MKRHWVEYTPTWDPSPMSFWVHLPQDGQAWPESESYKPPKPTAVVGRGYAQYFVEFDGFVFRFSSLDELRECITVLAKKLLPTTRQLSAGRGAGPNSHWLSRLPSFVKTWRYREKVVPYLLEVLRSYGEDEATRARLLVKREVENAS